MKKSSNVWFISLVVFVIWIAIVLGGEMLAVGGDPTGLDALVQGQIVPALVIAPIFLLIVVAYFKWWKETGLKWVDNNRSLLLLWLPALGIVFLLAVGLPTFSKGGQVLLFVLVNTLLVGISEELMFRGILLHSARTRYSLWAAIWIVSILFGLIHSLNGFLTGEFGPALIQAVMAFFSGVMFMGLRLRQGSILPVMVVHGLWDFSVFTAAGTTLALVGTIFPVLFLIYGLWLLRDYRHGEAAGETIE
jgi:membrane protease YdiL (CAAX protease family)